MNQLVPLAHLLYYIATAVPGLAGWIKGYDSSAALALIGGQPFLNIQKLNSLTNGGQHWGWVKAREMLAFTEDNTVTAMLLRFLYLSGGADALEISVAVPDIWNEIIPLQLDVRIESDDVFLWKGTPCDPDQLDLYISAGFAKDILHVVTTAKMQGVPALGIRLDSRPRSDESGQWSQMYVQDHDGVDLPIQPLFVFLQFK